MLDKNEIVLGLRQVPESAPPARLIFDSSVSPQRGGMRGMTEDRHLVFVDEDLDVHIKIAVSGTHHEIYGQVIPRVSPERAFRVMLLGEEEHSQETVATDDIGEFAFDEVPAGNLSIEVVTPSRSVGMFFEV